MRTRPVAPVVLLAVVGAAPASTPDGVSASAGVTIERVSHGPWAEAFRLGNGTVEAVGVVVRIRTSRVILSLIPMAFHWNSGVFVLLALIVFIFLRQQRLAGSITVICEARFILLVVKTLLERR